MAVSWFVYPVFHRLQDNAVLTSLMPTRVSGVMVKVTGFGLAFSSSACDLYSMMNSHCFWRSLLSSDRFISTRIMYWNHTHHNGSILTCTEITHHNGSILTGTEIKHVTMVQFLLYMYINSGVTPWQPLSPFVTFPTLNPFSPEAYYMLLKCSFLSRTDLKWGQTDHKCSLWECCSKCGCTDNFEFIDDIT